MRKKLGLALGGGSALGNAHLGVLQSLEDHSIPIDCISGTSAGAVVAACYAFGVSLEKMHNESKKVGWRSVFKFSPSKLGLISNEALADLLGLLIGGDKRIERAPIPLAIVATDLRTGEKITYRKGSLFKAVRASASIPIIFTPVLIKRRFMVDGGLSENVPMSSLTEMGADIRIGVNLVRWPSQKAPKSMLDVINSSIRIASQYKVSPLEHDVLIEPHLERYISTDFTKLNEITTQGYRATRLRIPEIKNLLQEE